MASFLAWKIKRPKWFDNPPDRWNAGLVMAGNAWRAQMQSYPVAKGSPGVISNIRTGAMGAKSTFVVADYGRVMELWSTFYWPYLMYGTGIYGPTGNPITPKSGRFLSWTVTGGNMGHILISSGVRVSKGKIRHNKKRDVYRVFAKSVTGTIWEGKLEEIQRAIREALQVGIAKYR